MSDSNAELRRAVHEWKTANSQLVALRAQTKRAAEIAAERSAKVSRLLAARDIDDVVLADAGTVTKRTRTVKQAIGVKLLRDAIGECLSEDQTAALTGHILSKRASRELVDIRLKPL